jgi:DNA-binding CsgD family transcriptional regulator
MGKIWWWWVVLLCGTRAAAQPGILGLPPVNNFQKRIYQAGTQSWDIAQDARGIMYFANNEGLLQYDGTLWTCYPISNGTCVRALWIAPSNRIYVGGQGDFGYFAPNEMGRLQYHSLLGQIPEDQRRFEDVWDIASTSDGTVWFRTNDRVFRYQAHKITALVPGSKLRFMNVVQDILYVEDAEKGLLRFNGQDFLPTDPAAHFNSPVTGMVGFGRDTVLIATLKNGLFLYQNNQMSHWTTSVDAFLCQKRIYALARLGSGQLALGTSLGGILVIDMLRRPLLWLEKNAGLQNNNVLSVFCDRAQNLWLGLDNGIDLVEMSAPFYRLLPDPALQGTGYAATVFDQKLYLGSSNGLYAKNWQNYYDPFTRLDFDLVPGTTGQVWALQQADHTLFMGHHEGAFQINGNQASNLSDQPGAWTFLPLDDTTLIAGSYNGLSLYHRRNSNEAWKYAWRLSGLDESCRIMVRENNGTLWMSHPYRGVFKIQLQPDRRSVTVQRFGKDSGLPSDLFNYIFKIGDIAVVAAERGIYRFDTGSGKFIAATELNQWLDPAHGRIRYLREDLRGNIWFSQGNNVGVLWVEDQGVHKRVRKELFPALYGQLVGGFEHIYPYDAQNVFFGTEKGFMLLNPARLHKIDTSLQVVINSVRFPDLQDSLLFGGFPADPALAISLPSQRNNLHFAFSATEYAQTDPVQYSVRLEGLDAVWSPWSSKTERDFAHLPSGKYTFMVKARTASGLESEVCAFTFRILPPWYANRWAYLFYAAFVITVLVASFRRQRVRFEAEKAALTTEHQQQSEEQRRRMEQSEQEIVRLQNEKLENEVQFKNKELALATMHLVQKGEILSSIQEELQKTLQKNQDGKSLRDDLQRIMRMVQYDTQLDDDWEQFAVHFDSVYGDFLKRLRERHPQLSPYDLRLSAYLRMNLSSKELAHLMNISVRGVEGSRYRLRKKLNLGGEDHLVEYLMNV